MSERGREDEAARRRTALVWSLCAILLGSSSFAKPPALDNLFPAGAARGQTAAVAASGSFDRWPVKAWVEGGGVEIKAEQEKGKLSISVAADAAPGVRWVRLFDDGGATSLRPFVVGTIPEVMEAEPNDDPRGPQPIDTPTATVNGRLAKRGEVDGFSIKLSRDQTLVADLEANRRLGSPIDAVLQVVSPGGFVLAQNDDTVGLDPRIVFQAPADGPYVVRLFAFPATPDSSIRFAGGDSSVYRLTLTTAGFLDHVFPLAVSGEHPGTVEAVGVNVPDEARRLALLPGDRGDVLTVSHPLLAGTAEVCRVSTASTVEAEPNDPAHAQAISETVAVSGRLDPAGDRDTFLVTLKKGDKRLFRVESDDLGLPLDPVLVVSDASGKPLAESDDARERRDPELTFAVPADGVYRVSLHDLNGRGGSRFAYLLSVLVPEPDFALTLADDRFEVSPGKPASVTVAVARKDGFSGPIEVVAEDLPDGVTACPATSRPGDESAKSVTLRLSVDDRACPGPFRVVGETADDPPRRRSARAAIAGFEAKTDRPWLTIRPGESEGKK